ncbi:hypothetical protein QJQ45_013334 [Haematococcus lacustris]|nr:hypothetical protein QJQ45_013334 [Haematococcus lacustris]
MDKRRRLCLVTKEGGTAAVAAPAAAAAPPPAPSLLDLPISPLNYIISQAMQRGATSALARTCSALYDRVLLQTPALRIQLKGERRDQLVAPRITAALRARTGKLALVLQQDQQQLHQQHTEEWLAMLGSCSAVQACKLHSTQAFGIRSTQPLTCTPHLAQRLLWPFPSLTSLSLTGYSVTHTGLASLLSHPQLALQLQQLDITGTTVQCPPQPDEPGAETLNNLFQGLRLKQLSLDVSKKSPLPNLQPLAQHLTQLHITAWASCDVAVGFLPLLQVLKTSYEVKVEHGSLPQLLQALPRLHTLHLPGTSLRGQHELDALLAATQLTSIQLYFIYDLTRSRADAPCSWQRLELTARLEFTASSYCNAATIAAYLPLHSLTHPLLFDNLEFNSWDSTALVTAAVHNLTQACKVKVKVKLLTLELMSDISGMPGSHGMRELLALLQPLCNCWRNAGSTFTLNGATIRAKDVEVLAPLCQGCTHLKLYYGSLAPTVRFWRQVVQLLPTVSQVTFFDVKGVYVYSSSTAMCQSLRGMAEQPWARWLDIKVRFKGQSLSAGCQANYEFQHPSQPQKFEVSFVQF